MTLTRSLRLRLSAGAIAVIVLTLVITGLSLSSLFTRHLERRIGQELDTHLAHIIGTIRMTDATISLSREPSDPRFQQIFGGLYWQVGDTTTGQTLKSRSLWDTALDLPLDAPAPGEKHVHDLAGPQDTTLFAHEEVVIVPAPDGDHRMRVAVAIDRGELEGLASGFSRDLAGVLAILGVVLIVGLFIQVSSGLRPVGKVLAGIAAIRSGAARRMDAEGAPAEIAPLVDEVNALLDAQEADMTRARDRAADLAHGLKTPLTALAADIARLRAKGEGEIADDIDELAARMRRHMERELARARMRHGRSTDGANVAPVIDAVARTLRRTPAGETIAIDVHAGGAIRAAIDREDLSEIVGNLMENAIRHARTRIIATAAAANGVVTVSIADDGPGLDDAAREAALTRGGRLDTAGQHASGAGLGLAIVGDILAACGGRLILGRSEVLGGLEAAVTLPAAVTPQ